MKTFLFVCVCVAVLAGVVYAQTTNSEETNCNQKTNCDDCLAGNSSINLECYWCSKPTNRTGPKCRHFTFNSAIPVDGIECENLMYNAASCRINALGLVIIIVIACLVVVIAVCCVCCCCCYFFAKRRQRSKMLEDERYLDEKERIRQRSSDRRAERKAKSDEIKKKYGLTNDAEGAGTYKRLD